LFLSVHFSFPSAMKSVLMASSVAFASAHFIESCSTDAAHVQNLQITVSPDDHQMGEDVTIIAEGDIAKAIHGGSVALGIKLGGVDLYNLDIPFSSNLEGVAGHVKVTVGPLKYPTLPGIDVTSLQIVARIVDQDAEEFACLIVNGPTLSNDKLQLEAPLEEEAKQGRPVFADCSDSTSHLKNFHIEGHLHKGILNQDLTVTTGGDLEKAVSAGTVDVSLGVLGIKVDASVPFAIEPSVPTFTGTEFTVGPIRMPRIPGIKVTGSVKVADQDDESLACVTFNLPIAEEEAVTV